MALQKLKFSTVGIFFCSSFFSVYGQVQGGCKTIAPPEVFQHEFTSDCGEVVRKKLCSMSITCKNDPRYGNIDVAEATCGVNKEGKCKSIYACASDKNYLDGIPIGNSDLESFKQHPLKDGDYIKGCLEKIPEGKVQDVHDRVIFPCNNKKEIKGGGLRKYSLRKEGGKMVVSTSIYFNFLGSQGSKADRFERVRSAKKCMQDFFTRHGLVLDIKFQGDKDSDHKEDCDHSINLHDNMNREDSKNWSSVSSGGKEMTPQERCGTYLHELFHRLGLPDSYSDPFHCPDRQNIHGRDSIMACLPADCSQSRLYDEHLKMLLDPMCGKVV